MKSREELLETRNQLRDRLATETHNLSSAYQDERLGKIAHVLAGIAAIDMVLEYELDPPENDGPIGFFVSR